MKTLMMVVFLALVASTVSAQTETTLETRAAVTNDGAATYRLLEVYQTKGHVVPWDIGYIDFGGDVYREFFVGAGGVLNAGKKVTLIQEGYFVQAVGPNADSARYFQPFSLLLIDFGKQWSGTVNYLLYVPINKTATVQHVFDRIKLEYDFGRWKLGVGHSAYKFGSEQWQNKPFVSGTVKLGRAGSLEMWIQKINSGMQVRVNYVVSKK